VESRTGHKVNRHSVDASCQPLIGSYKSLQPKAGLGRRSDRVEDQEAGVRGANNPARRVTYQADKHATVLIEQRDGCGGRKSIAHATGGWAGQ